MDSIVNKEIDTMVTKFFTWPLQVIYNASSFKFVMWLSHFGPDISILAHALCSPQIIHLPGRWNNYVVVVIAI